MALPASDNFTRADANPVGGNWTTTSGLTGCKIVSNNLTGITAGNNCASYWNADAFGNDHYAEVTFAAAGATRGCGPVVRDQKTTIDLYGYSASNKRLFKIGTGVGLTFLETAQAETWATGDVCRLSAEGASPTTLKLYKNGSLLRSLADSSAAMQSGGGAGAYFDGDIATSGDAISLWGADNLAVTAALSPPNPQQWSTLLRM